MLNKSMRIQQLQYIIKIVETGSMNEAANNSSSLQPSLPCCLDLENEMGIEILSETLKDHFDPRWDGVLSYAARWWSRLTLV